MKNLFARILNAGVHRDLSRSLLRTIVLTNALALIMALLSTVILVNILSRAGWKLTNASIAIFIILAVLCLILFLNHRRIYDLSRFLLSIVIPVASITVYMIPRISDASRFHYLPRTPQLFCLLLAFCVVPLLVLSVRERRVLIPALAINIIILVAVDPAMFYFSADRNTSYTLPRFLGNNLTILVSATFLMGSIIFLKNLFEDFEVMNDQLIRSLNEKNAALEHSNRELFQLNQDIETQNEEIQAQSEELMQSQESLVIANHKIEQQKVELENQNQLLEHLLAEKKQDLILTNQQLVSRNTELEQFSYTISHNLRGPVASLLGLINIIQLTENEDDRIHILKLIQQSALSLETVIKDLNKIIDIRHDKFNLNEEVHMPEVLTTITESLKTFISDNNIDISHNFDSAQSLVSVKAYISSILYNLISNAIQYRNPERSATISIQTQVKDGSFVLEVRDNGLGIDLKRYKHDMYKLYKRFHDHIPGKGLGLYLVKQQVEKLNGTIEVESALNEGTVFRIVLPVLD